MTNQLIQLTRQLSALGLTAANLYIADLLGKGIINVMEYSEALRNLRRGRR